MFNVTDAFPPPAALRPTRRSFVLGAAAAAGGLVIGYGAKAAGPAKTAPKPEASPFAAYIKIAPDNTVTILSSQFDMGQGSYHGVATLVVEELGAGWDQIRVEGAAGDTALYGNLTWGGVAQGTGGSSTIATSFRRYREAGAAARMMLSEAAAAAWGVPAGEITAAAGRLTHRSGKSAAFGAFAAAAAALPAPKDVALKPSSAWTEIGNEAGRRHDSAAKTNGAHEFTIDVKLPGMLTAVMIHPPKFGAAAASFDAAGALAMPGVVDVVAIDRGVAVIGDNMWAALKGRDAVTVRWDESRAERRGSDRIIAEYRTLARGAPKAMARVEGDPAKAMAGAARVMEAEYSFPYLAHAAMEPLNAVARMNPDGALEVWGGHQLPDLYQFVASKIAGIEPNDVRLRVMKTGGGFGRRASPDADVISEAVAVAKAIGWKAPVKVQWTRENDMLGGRYRPAYVHRLRAGLDRRGGIVAWDHHIVGQSIVAGTPFQGMIQKGVDPTSVEGAHNLPYAIPNMAVGLTTTEVGVPVLWWRSVGSTHTAYATETFLDEIIRETGRDPLEQRLKLLNGRPRHAGVLRLAAEKAGWGARKPAAGRTLGLAVHESFRTFVAQVAEVSIEDGAPVVHRVVSAVDCGVAVNPDVIRAQVEGSVAYGLGSVLAEKLTIAEGGEVENANYDTYTPLRLNDMPEVETHIAPSAASPTGVGEPAVPPVGPAVANAVAAATGKVIRDLPMTG